MLLMSMPQGAGAFRRPLHVAPHGQLNNCYVTKQIPLVAESGVILGRCDTYPKCRHNARPR